MDVKDIKLSKDEFAVRRAFLFRLIAEESEQKRRQAQKAAHWRQAKLGAAPVSGHVAASQHDICESGLKPHGTAVSVGRGYKTPVSG